MNNNVCFKSKWFEKCIRDYLKVGADESITEEMLASITTHDYELAFGKEELPIPFEFSNAKLKAQLFVDATFAKYEATASYFLQKS